jgi:hypothetical protein
MYDDQWARDFGRKLEAALGASERAHRRPGSDQLDQLRQIGEEQAAREAELVGKWEAGRPMRERADVAFRRASARRRAELGLRGDDRYPLVAALWAIHPSERRRLIR